MANVTAMVRSLRAEEGTEVSRLASVVAAMEKGLESLQKKSSAATAPQGENTLPQLRYAIHTVACSTCTVFILLIGLYTETGSTSQWPSSMDDVRIMIYPLP